MKALEVIHTIDPSISVTDEEGKVLQELASKTKGHILEIGSGKGRSTIWLATRLKKRYKVFTVDPHPEEGWSEIFLNNIEAAGIATKISYIKKYSTSYLMNIVYKDHPRFAGVFIDGNHNYQDVKRDVSLCHLVMAPAAWIALHDTVEFPGCKKVAIEMMKKPYWKLIAVMGQLCIFQLVTPTLNNLFRNVWCMLLKALHDIEYTRQLRIHKKMLSLTATSTTHHHI